MSSRAIRFYISFWDISYGIQTDFVIVCVILKHSASYSKTERTLLWYSLISVFILMLLDLHILFSWWKEVFAFCNMFLICFFSVVSIALVSKYSLLSLLSFCLVFLFYSEYSLLYKDNNSISTREKMYIFGIQNMFYFKSKHCHITRNIK